MMPGLSRSLMEARHHLACAIHDFFRALGYISLDTPIMVRTPGTEVHLDYFSTAWRNYQGQSHTLYLRSSPELHLKRALCQGMERIYQLAKCFRNNGELTGWHHPEFTMLEWYQIGISYNDFMDMTTDLVTFALDRMKRHTPCALSLPHPIQRISVHEAFERFAGIALIDGDPALAAKAINRGYLSVRAEDDFETAYFKVLIDAIEPALTQLDAVYLYDFPPSQAALARVVDGVAKRFELYVHGVELCNAFWELLGEGENRARFEDSRQKRALLGKETFACDEEFISDLARGMPDCCGNALGFDRLLALLLGEKDISRVVPFRDTWPFANVAANTESPQ